MKYIVVLGDGMADYAVDEFNGKTVLEVFVDKNNNEIVLKVSDKKEEEESV